VSKNDVPDQKASIAVPFNFSVMMGSAILNEVASRAAARVIIHIEVNARRKPLEGLKAGVAASREGMSIDSLSPGRVALSDDAGISIVFSAARASSKLESTMVAVCPKVCCTICFDIDARVERRWVEDDVRDRAGPERFEKSKSDIQMPVVVL
jgi:hypothetical protein